MKIIWEIKAFSGLGCGPEMVINKNPAANVNVAIDASQTPTNDLITRVLK